MADRPISEVFYEIGKLATALGIKDASKLDGCWEYEIDEQWWMAVNSHEEPVKCSKNVTVKPFHAYVTFNGWPAGVLNPYDGVIAAGDAANEGTFIAALRAAQEKATGEEPPAP